MSSKIWAVAAFAACLLTSLTMAAQDQTVPPAPAMPPRPPRLTSEELAKQPQTPGATGDQQRHYYFAEGNVESPYRIYVPENYDGKKKLPLILALHGAAADQNYFFRANYGMPDLMEKYGFIFVEPFGYDAFGGYGATGLPRPELPPDPNVPPPPPGALARRPQRTPEENKRITELSEKDVMNVLDLVEKEYKIDTSRVYLMGHSMGGMGTWYLGQKYPEKWAALGAMSGGFGWVDYPLQRLKGIPIIVTAGGRDIAMQGPMAQSELARFKAAGLDITYIEDPQGDHMTNIPTTFPQVIDFLAAHHR
jgi:predicted esterase